MDIVNASPYGRSQERRNTEEMGTGKRGAQGFSERGERGHNNFSTRFDSSVCCNII